MRVVKYYTSAHENNPPNSLLLNTHRTIEERNIIYSVIRPEVNIYQQHMSRRSCAYFIGLMCIIPIGGKKTFSRKSMIIICQRKYAFCQISVLFVKTPVAPARLSTQIYMDFGGSQFSVETIR